MSKKCISCNEYVDDNALFCPKCGKQEFEVVSSNSGNPANYNLGQIGENKDNGVGFDTVEVEHSISGDQNVQTINQPQAQPQVQAVSQPQSQVQEQIAPTPSGVIDNSFFNNQGVPAQKKKKKKTRIDGKVIWTISGIIGTILLVVSLVLFILLALAGTDEDEPNIYDPASYFTEKNSKLIGNDDFGYIRIPSTWEDVTESFDGSSIVFTDSITNSKWYILLTYVNDGITTPDALATNSYNGLLADGALEVSVNQETVNSFSTYKLVGYKPNEQRYVAAWFFTTAEGKTRYIAIEGADRVNEFYNMIYTYKLTK